MLNPLVPHLPVVRHSHFLPVWPRVQYTVLLWPLVGVPFGDRVGCLGMPDVCRGLLCEVPVHAPLVHAPLVCQQVDVPVLYPFLPWFRNPGGGSEICSLTVPAVWMDGLVGLVESLRQVAPVYFFALQLSVCLVMSILLLRQSLPVSRQLLHLLVRSARHRLIPSRQGSLCFEEREFSQ